jgi:hypothetical protein
MRAAAKPRTLSSLFDNGVHRLACKLYKGFESDCCCEEDSKNIIAALRFLDELSYKAESLKFIKK